jgi:hypothetical protein
MGPAMGAACNRSQVRRWSVLLTLEKLMNLELVACRGQSAKDRIWPCPDQGDRDPQGLGRDRSGARFAPVQAIAIGTAHALIFPLEAGKIKSANECAD